MRDTSEPLRAVDEDGVVVIEGAPGVPVLAQAADVDRVIEACSGSGATAALLHAENLPVGFFDLSSRDAGTILQKLRNYGVRLAVVLPPERGAALAVRGVVAEERARRDFGVFPTREAARAWLRA